VESGSREENASDQDAGVFHRFHETVKDSSEQSMRTFSGEDPMKTVWVQLVRTKTARQIKTIEVRF